jgi:hypothetical protein
MVGFVFHNVKILKQDDKTFFVGQVIIDDKKHIIKFFKDKLIALEKVQL